MHPLVKIVMLLTACQVLQTTYTLRRLHRAHVGWRWWAEMTPLIFATLAMIYLTLRLLEAIPYVAVI